MRARFDKTGVAPLLGQLVEHPRKHGSPKGQCDSRQKNHLSSPSEKKLKHCIVTAMPNQAWPGRHLIAYLFTSSGQCELTCINFLQQLQLGPTTNTARVIGRRGGRRLTLQIIDQSVMKRSHLVTHSQSRRPATPLILSEDVAVRGFDGDGEGDSISNALGNSAKIFELRQSAIQMAWVTPALLQR